MHVSIAEVLTFQHISVKNRKLFQLSHQPSNFMIGKYMRAFILSKILKTPPKNQNKKLRSDINILVVPRVGYGVPCDVHQCVTQRMVDIWFIDGQFRIHLHLHILCLQNDRSGHVWINQPNLGPVRILFNCGYT
jgi:hypothetical protein